MSNSKPSSAPMRVAIMEGAICLAADVAECLRTHEIEPIVVDRAETAIRTLAVSPEAWDAVVYPVSARWQLGLDFAREARRIRECAGGRPCTPVLILSTTAQHPITIDLFRRANAKYSTFTSSDDLACVLESIRQDSLKAKREAQKLHFRLVHVGNPAGIGCTRHEQLSAIYASFQPGEESPVRESPSVLHFLNLLGMNHWRFRTASEIVHLMRQSPFYVPSSINATVVSVSSVKTYIARVETALSNLWRQIVGLDDPPRFIAREARGGRVVAYRLLSTSEIDHV